MNKKAVAGDKYSRYGYMFIAPFFIVMLVFNIYPMLYSIFLSFTKWDGGTSRPEFIGLSNFLDLMKDTLFYQSILNTWIIWLMNFIPQMIFAIGLAAILADKYMQIKGKGFFRGIYYLPNLVTMASVGLLFYYILDWQSGTLNKLLISLNLLKEPFEWLQDPLATRLAISFTLWWMWFGYSMIIFMAGINAIPDELFEAARVDGASKWQTFWNITLPSIKGSIMYNIITSIIGGMTIFDVPYVLTNGVGSPLDKALTTVNYMFNMTFRNNNFGYGATIYTGMFLLIVIVVALSFNLISKNYAKE